MPGRTSEEYIHLIHTFEPAYDGESRILILGSFPSVKSRESGFYYGHPQNRFWRLAADLRGEKIPRDPDEKKEFLRRNRIALYDVIGECDIRGSSDSSVRNAVPTDLRPILEGAPVRTIYVNGKLAEKLYRRFQEKTCGRPCVPLPSTSPANAAWTFPMLRAAWAVINRDLDG